MGHWPPQDRQSLVPQTMQSRRGRQIGMLHGGPACRDPWHPHAWAAGLEAMVGAEPPTLAAGAGPPELEATPGAGAEPPRLVGGTEPPELEAMAGAEPPAPPTNFTTLECARVPEGFAGASSSIDEVEVDQPSPAAAEPSAVG